MKWNKGKTVLENASRLSSKTTKAEYDQYAEASALHSLDLLIRGYDTHLPSVVASLSHQPSLKEVIEGPFA